MNISLVYIVLVRISA